MSLIFALLIGASFSYAGDIPPHMANMASQLYKSFGDELKGEHLNKERRTVLEKSIKTLKKMKIERWTAKPVTVHNSTADIATYLELDYAKATDRALLKNFVYEKGEQGTKSALKSFSDKANRKIKKDEINRLATEIDEAYSSAFESLEKDVTVKGENGSAVQFKWNPDVGMFFLKVFNDGKTGEEEFAANFNGNVKTDLSDNGKDMVLHTSPAKNAVRSMTAEDIEFMRANILGKWQNDDGTLYIFSATEETAGEVRPPREYFETKIEEAKDKLKTVKDKKLFTWKNPKDGKTIEQEKFRRLKEPFVFIGEEYALKGAKEKIASLEKEISDLENERDGLTLPPSKRFDPAGYQDMKLSGDSQTILVQVSRPDGYVYNYDDAAFDGRRITARRTYKNIEDMENEQLPNAIKQMLLSDGWEPPGWLEMEASVDAETGDLLLEGFKWSLHVTYESFFGSDFEIKSIHTPYSQPQRLKREGSKFESAEGASLDEIP